MNLGRLDVCLRVASAAASREFYERLGFVGAEGDESEGWCIVVREDARIGLFESQFMGSDAFSLNFRDGNIREIAGGIGDCGAEIRYVGATGGSIRLRDPDGHLLFFDSSGIQETKARENL